jgi:hypothetical protein
MAASQLPVAIVARLESFARRYEQNRAYATFTPSRRHCGCTAIAPGKAVPCPEGAPGLSLWFRSQGLTAPGDAP